MKDINDYQLTENITVGELKVWIVEKNDTSKNKIIEFINHRFTNRYLKHLNNIDIGFLKMAICCLTIETLECFKQGRENTRKNGAGIKMLKDFFKTEKHNFPEFENIYKAFYYNIRCGILHQAETNNAWRIRRDGELLNLDERCINSVKFVKALEKSLDDYLYKLQSEKMDSELWGKAITKLESICRHCEASN